MTEEDYFKQFDPVTASGEELDKLCGYVPLMRQVYGVLYREKPNDHCYWNSDFGFWEENDEHFRNRLKEKSK